MLNAMTDEEYMQLALQEARAADVIGEIPVSYTHLRAHET